MLVVRKYCREFVTENTKIMKNLSTCYSRDLVMYRPVRMQPIACPRSRFPNSQTHICDDISIPSQGKTVSLFQKNCHNIQYPNSDVYSKLAARTSTIKSKN